MSGHRHSARKAKADKRAERAKPDKRSDRKQSVSLADRLEPVTPSTGDGSVLPGGGPARSRKAAREQRKHQARRRSLTVAGAVAAVVVLAVLVVWWLGRDDSEVAPPPDVGRTQQTLALTLAREPDAPATDAALLAADEHEGNGAVVLVPPNVFVSGSTPEPIPFGDTVGLEPLSAPGDALADNLGVIVDGTWQATPAGLAAIVDELDGITVDVDSDILTPPGDGQQRVVIAAGEGQRLDGEQTVAFVEYLGPNEPEELRQARFGQVIDQVAQKLPSEPDQVASLLTQTSASANTTFSTDELATFLAAFGDAARGGDVNFQTLPTLPLDTGGPREASRIDPDGAAQLRETVLAGSVPEGSDGVQIRVLVENGVGTPGLEEGAAKLLRADGYKFLNGGNAQPFDDDNTVVLIPDATPASIELGNNVADTLGVPRSAVKTTDLGSNVSDVIVILGVDFDS
ncbi:MAG TPA: LCP family protein [Actinomycetes bacterium]|nr:LCP family protein [Actinomycetes bacterium]